MTPTSRARERVLSPARTGGFEAMSRPARQSLRRLAQLSLAAIVGIVGLPILTSGANVANAADTLQCKTEGDVYVSIANSPGFNLRKQAYPADGYNQWNSDAGIGNGWDHHFVSGPNGYIWFTLDNGELRRHRRVANTWADNGISELIATGWGGWNLPQYRYRFTVDSTNTLYTVDQSGSLKQYKYNESTKQLTEKVIEAGWGKYDQVFAAGEGVLYARDPNVQDGTLYRYHYDDATGTWKQREKNLGWGWKGYKQLTSPGGDIIYGTFPGGETWWYRYVPARDGFQNGAGGEWKQRISTWNDVDEIAPAIDTCRTGEFASDVECRTGAHMWGVGSDNSLYLRSHQEPASGLTSWNLSGHIGNGWGGNRYMAGADGYKFYITPGGEVHRHRWIEATASTPGHWDKGGISDRIATGWGGWTDPRYFNRITVDSNNHFYGALYNGELQFSIYNDAAKTWTQEIIDNGWGKYDQVFAAGDGVLYARDPNIQDGTLFRFHYDWKNRRWIEYARNVGWGWNGYQQILSAGGDVVIGRSGFDVWWYRWDNTAKQWANSAEGSWKEHIAWWQDLQGMMIDVDACKLKNPEKITPPQTPAPAVDKAGMIYNEQKSRFEIAYSDGNGTLHHLYQQVPNSEQVTFEALSSTGYTGRASIAQREDNKVIVQARGVNAQVKAFMEPASGEVQWSQKDVNGALNTSPVLARGTNKVLTAFAVDGGNKLWYSEQFGINGDFKPWRKATSSDDYNITGDMTVVPFGDGFEIAYTDPAGTVAVQRFVNGALNARRTAGGITAVGTPAAVVFSDGKVQVVARASDNKLYTQKEGASGFPGWTDISGAMRFTGTPEALLNKFNIVEVVARDTSGAVHRGGQTAPGSTTWRMWADTSWSSPFDVTFRASTGGAGGNEQRIFVNSGEGFFLLIDSPPYSSDQTQAMPADASTSLSKSSVDAPAKATKLSSSTR